jgi:hypothetical protein
LYEILETRGLRSRGTTITLSIPTPSPSATGGPALTFSGQITGSTGTTPSWTSPTFETDNTLQVRITPNQAGSIVSGTPNVDSYFTGIYNCAEFTVVVLGDTVTTQPMALDPSQPCWSQSGSPIYGVQSSQLIDFSSRLSSGHGAISVAITGGATDDYCQWLADNVTNPYSSAYMEYNWTSLFCEVRAIYKTHVATFTVGVGIDGTVSP